MRLTGFMYGISITLIWAAWVNITHLGLVSNLSVYDLFALRLMVACLLIAPVFWLTKSWRGLSFKRYFILAMLAGIPHSLLVYGALERTSIEQFSVFLYGAAPFLTALISYLCFRHKVSKNLLLGAIMVISGMLLIVVSNFQQGIDLQMLLGNLMATLAIASFAGFLVLADRWQISISQSIIACTLINGVLYLPVWLLMSDFSKIDFSSSAVQIQAIVQGVIPGILAVYVTALATKQLGANMTSLFFALIPALATGVAVVMFDERLTANILIGLLLSCSGVIVCTVPLSSITAFFKLKYSKRETVL